MSIQAADTLKFAEDGRLSPIADELEYYAFGARFAKDQAPRALALPPMAQPVFPFATK